MLIKTPFTKMLTVYCVVRSRTYTGRGRLFIRLFPRRKPSGCGHIGRLVAWAWTPES